MKMIRKFTVAQLALLALAAAFVVLASPKHAQATPPTCLTECNAGWNGCGSIGGFTCYRS